MSNISINISTEKRKACKLSLEWLKTHSSLNADGFIRTDGTPDSAAALLVIYNSVDIRPPIPDGTKLRVTDLALSRWYRYKKYQDASDPVEALKRALEVELNNFLKKQTKFTVLMFLNVDQECITTLSPLTIQGYDIKFPGWNGLEALKLSEFWREVEFFFGVPSGRGNAVIKTILAENKIYHIRNTSKLTPVIVTVDAYNVNTAVAIAAKVFDLLRVSLNLLPAWRILRRWGARSQALAKFLPSPIYGVFDQKGEYIRQSIYHATEEYTYKLQKFDEQEGLYSTELINKHFNNTQTGKFSQFLIELLTQYQQMLDFTDYRATYLALWQVLETLTLTQPRDSGKQIEERITAFLALEGEEMLKLGLSVIARSRHALVHLGSFPDYPEELVFLLKHLVDLSLMRMIKLAEYLSTKDELRDYFRYATKNDKSLISSKKVIDLIQNARKS